MDQPEQIQVAVLEEKMKTLKEGLDKVANKIDSLIDKVDNNYVKKEDFKSVKDIVDGLKYWQGKVIGYAAAIALIIEFILRYFLK